MLNDFHGPWNKTGWVLAWCQQREKNDWQEARKFDCQLVWTIFIFCCLSLGRFRGQGKFWLGKKFKDRFFIG